MSFDDRAELVLKGLQFGVLIHVNELPAPAPVMPGRAQRLEHFRLHPPTIESVLSNLKQGPPVRAFNQPRWALKPSFLQQPESESERRFLNDLNARLEKRPSEQARAIVDELFATGASEDDAIELVYRRLHELIDKNDFDVIDRLLRMLDVRRQMPSVLLSILTATAMSDVKTRLASRPDFVARTRDFLTSRDGAAVAEELLFGLE